MEVIKVSAHSRSTAVAGAIAGVMRDHKHAEVQAIGASAVNQAVKAIAIARNYLALDGMQIVCLPEFVEIDIEGRNARRSSSSSSHGEPRSTAPGRPIIAMRYRPRLHVSAHDACGGGSWRQIAWPPLRLRLPGRVAASHRTSWPSYNSSHPPHLCLVVCPHAMAPFGQPAHPPWPAWSSSGIGTSIISLVSFGPCTSTLTELRRTWTCFTLPGPSGVIIVLLILGRKLRASPYKSFS